MLAGGIGYTTERDALKGEASAGDKIVVMGGDNYRIGMGGGAVSSVNTGQYEDAIEAQCDTAAPILRCRSVSPM